MHALKAKGLTVFAVRLGGRLSGVRSSGAPSVTRFPPRTGDAVQWRTPNKPPSPPSPRCRPCTGIDLRAPRAITGPAAGSGGLTGIRRGGGALRSATFPHSFGRT